MWWALRGRKVPAVLTALTAFVAERRRRGERGRAHQKSSIIPRPGRAWA
jgi:hypothetical protein